MKKPDRKKGGEAPRRQKLAEILAALDRFYPKTGLEDGFGAGSGSENTIEVVRRVEAEDADEKELLKLTENPPVVRFCNAILADAIKLDASDIHIEQGKSA